MPDNHWAKARRLYRIGRADGTYLLLALDHGMSLGPLAGLQDFDICATDTLHDNFTGVVLNRGSVARALFPGSSLGLVLQLCGSTSNDSDESKIRLIAPTDALSINPDAVAVELHLERGWKESGFSDVADTVTQCGPLGLPVLLMLTPKQGEPHVDNLVRALRTATELGVDLIKVGLPEELKQEPNAALAPLIKAIQLAPPILLAGGPAAQGFTEQVRFARTLGFRGVCVGRNVFQASDPPECIEAISKAYSDDGAGGE